VWCGGSVSRGESTSRKTTVQKLPRPHAVTSSVAAVLTHRAPLQRNPLDAAGKSRRDVGRPEQALRMRWVTCWTGASIPRFLWEGHGLESPSCPRPLLKPDLLPPFCSVRRRRDADGLLESLADELRTAQEEDSDPMPRPDSLYRGRQQKNAGGENRGAKQRGGVASRWADESEKILDRVRRLAAGGPEERRVGPPLPSRGPSPTERRYAVTQPSPAKASRRSRYDAEAATEEEPLESAVRQAKRRFHRGLERLESDFSNQADLLLRECLADLTPAGQDTKRLHRERPRSRSPVAREDARSSRGYEQEAVLRKANSPAKVYL